MDTGEDFMLIIKSSSHFVPLLSLASGNYSSTLVNLKLYCTVTNLVASIKKFICCFIYNVIFY